MDTIRDLLEGLADAASSGHKSEFDRLERELLTHFDGSFDAMPADVYGQYLEIDRLWPVVAPSSAVGVGREAAAARRNILRVSLTARDEAWLRRLGAAADRGLSAVLTACLAVIREDDGLGDAVRRHLERPPNTD